MTPFRRPVKPSKRRAEANEQRAGDASRNPWRKAAGRQPTVAPPASKSTEIGENAGATDVGEHDLGPASGPLTAGLYVVSTPIGNLGDISLRALATLKGADTIACEDTRVTAVLLRRYGIGTALTPYHDHNADRVRPRLLAEMAAGARIALVSDAGTPLLSDPGYKLVQACVASGLQVIPIPGASALLAALVTAALPTDRVLFAGFLPPKSGARRRVLEEVAEVPATLVFYETGPRLAESLADMTAVLGDRPASVCRELTKRFEETRRGTLAGLSDHYATAGAPRGEIAVVIGGPIPSEVSAEDVDIALRAALETLSVRDAATQVAATLNQPKRVVYARALALSKGTP